MMETKMMNEGNTGATDRIRFGQHGSPYFSAGAIIDGDKNLILDQGLDTIILTEGQVRQLSDFIKSNFRF